MNEERQCPGINRLKNSKILIWIVIAFTILNTLKVTIFNFIMIDDKSIVIFITKFIVTLVVIALIFSVLFIFNKRILWYIFYIIQVIYIGGFLCYYDYFNSIFHLFQMATLFPEGAAVVKHFSIPFQLNMLVSIIDLPLFIIFCLIYKQLKVKQFVINYKKKIIILLLSVLVIGEMISILTNTSFLDYAIDYPKKENEMVARYGTALNSVYDYIFNADGEGLLKQYEYGETISKNQTKETPSNVLMIQVESLDANIIHATHNGEYIMPFISKMADENIYHRRMLSYHLAGGTSDAEYAILNSVEPLTSFPSMKLQGDTYPNSIAKIFHGVGYHVNGYHGNIGSFYNRTNGYKQMGFDNFYDISKMGLKDIEWGASDGEVFDFAYETIQKEKEPFFSYIVTMTSHTPFDYVDDYVTIQDFDDIKVEETKQYYKSVRYVDIQIQHLVERVLSLYPNTIVAIYGDHTPGDLNDYTKSSYIINKEYFEFVPLIIITPEHLQYKNTEYAVSFLDMAPTILDMSGIPYMIRSKGESLISCKMPHSEIPFRTKSYNRSTLITNEHLYDADN